MKLYVTTEQHFYKLKGYDSIFVEGVEDASFFKRYLDEFEEVIVIGRLQELTSVENLHRKVNGERIGFFALPDFVGFSGLLKNLLPTLNRLFALSQQTDSKYSAFILRTPGIIADLVWLCLSFTKSRYSVEVVSDPFDMYGKNSVGVSFSSFFQKIGVFNTKKQCRYALTSAYVTREALQRRYPPGNEYTYSYTSLDLDERIFDFFPQVYKKAQATSEQLNPIRLIFIGTLGRPYKGQDILFKAVHKLKNRGYSVKLKVVGSGRLEPDFKQMVKDLDINNLVEFVGQLKPGQEVYQELADSDIFVLPSRQEGLPRVLIEAMAVGLPCIATDVGGVFELLEEEEMIEIDQVNQLVDKIIYLAQNKDRRLQVMKQNFKKAQQYRPEFIQDKRNKHYRKLIEIL